MTTRRSNFAVAGSPARDSLTELDTCGLQQQPAGAATLSGSVRSGTAFVEPHPQPCPVPALASASATQQASTFVGAGPPQHPDDAWSEARSVEHTPVSGRTRWMSS